MNSLYVYQYRNGVQFLSTANPTLIKVSIAEGLEHPNALGKWNFKKVKNTYSRIPIISSVQRHKFIKKNMDLFNKVSTMSWKIRYRCEEGAKLVAMARDEFGFSDKTSASDILNGFLNFHKHLTQK
jgi:hypothetical protein